MIVTINTPSSSQLVTVPTEQPITALGGYTNVLSIGQLLDVDTAGATQNSLLKCSFTRHPAWTHKGCQMGQLLLNGMAILSPPSKLLRQIPLPKMVLHVSKHCQ